MIACTGFPPGYVLSPLLFIVYTNCCTSTFSNRHFIRYADDTALEEHGPVLDYFLNWCEKSNLLLNTTKTKETSIDFRKLKSSKPTFINREPINLSEITSILALYLITNSDGTYGLTF
ncbi:hypothetical protein LDENG_00136880 [Lucifuga dentata]|nr:hypothetical protein LDENG_00136880 [Lucifuga dentata]